MREQVLKRLKALNQPRDWQVLQEEFQSRPVEWWEKSRFLPSMTH